MTSKFVTYRVLLSDSQEWCVSSEYLPDPFENWELLEKEIDQASKQRGFNRNQITDIIPVSYVQEKETLLSK